MAFDIREEDEHLDEFEEYDDIKKAEHPKFYRRRKFWMFCIPNAIISLIVAVLLGLYVIMPKIAQGLMNKATIQFSQIDITNPTASSMDIVMQGKMDNTGPFGAEISFPGIVTVSWNDIVLGTTQIPGTSKASGGSGTLNLASSFTVTNATGFSEFSAYMLNAKEFVWHLEGKLNVKALSHTVKDLDLKKDITISAFNGLDGIKIEKFSLPGDDPSGKGIIIEIDTTVNNPSAIQMYMGSLTLAISYKDVLMGYVTSTNLTMNRGPQTMSMKGILIPQNSTQGLAVTSEMMSRYIGNVVTNTTATGVEVKPDGVNSLDWLSAAVKNLKLNVPLQSPAPLQLIKGLNLGALGLVFTPPTAYQPVTTSTGVLANYSLPDGFGFNIQFQQVSNEFALTRGGVVIANLNSSYNPSTSNMAAGTLTFDLLATPLLVPDASHQSFQEFNRDLTVGADLPFQVTGQASVFANTSIGVVNLVNIPFNASTQLSGLQSLANPAPTITSLQVVSGTTTGLTMAISVVIINPSSISLNAGDIVLALMYKDVNLGTVTMPNLAIVPGANTVATTSTIDPAKSPEGLELLNLYTSGAGATVNIVGTPTSTTVESLNLAFGALNIQTQMPGLQSKLLAGASLVVLDTTLANGLAQTVVTVNNPFVPDMTILSIDSKITYNGVSLGTVISTFATPPVIPGVGQGTITASLTMNTDPHDLITLIRTQALKNGMNTAAFDGLLSLQAGGNPPSSLFVGFNVADFTLKAMTGLLVDITMTTTVKVGDYQVTIPYVQNGVATTTDQSVLKLIPIVGTPIAQVLVNSSSLQFDSINILNPAETAFKTDIAGAIANTGPLDAQIQFPNPVTVSYNGKAIGSMMMPTVNAIADKGADLDLKGVDFTITDAAAYTDFTVYALNNAKFDWTISTTGLIVTAMGVPLPGVSMTKTVTLDGFNKLAGLELTGYMIETTDTAGLHMSIGAQVNNPSTIGMVIPTSLFTTMFQGKVLGPAVATGMVLLPHQVSVFSLNATIATGNGNMIPYLEDIFHNAVSNISTPLKAQGVGAPGLSWLDAAIKTLSLDTALPPLSDAPIVGVSIDAMTMDFTCNTCVWSPNAISTITAQTNLPFRNGAPIIALSQNIEILDKNDRVVGTLVTDYADAIATADHVTSTSKEAALTILPADHKTYTDFISDLSEADKYPVGLRGTANSKLRLGDLGDIEVKGIKLDVRTTLDGLQGLKKIAFMAIVNLDVSNPAMIASYSEVNVHNPSKLTLKIGDLTMNAGTNWTDAGFAGHSLINNLTLVPGDNILTASVLFDSRYDASRKLLADLFANGVTVYLKGSKDSSKNEALAAGLGNLQSTTTLPKGGLNDGSVKPYDDTWSIKVFNSTANDGIVEVSGVFRNPYPGIDTTYETMDCQRDINYANQVIMFTSSKYDLFDAISWIPDPKFKPLVTHGNQSYTVSWAMQLGLYRDGTAAPTMDASVYDEIIANAAQGPIRIFTMFNPVLSIQGVPGQVSTDLGCSSFYPVGADTNHCNMFLKTDSNFPLIREYFNKLRNPGGIVSPSPTVPTPTPTTTTTTTDTFIPTPSPIEPIFPTVAPPTPVPISMSTTELSPPVRTEPLLIPTATP